MSDGSEKEPTVHAAMPAVGAGPEADLARMFRDHHRLVLRAAYRITGNAQDAEDVLQTVFLRLIRREGGSPLSDSLAGYLHRAAVNAALDLVRSRRSDRVAPLQDVQGVAHADEDQDPGRLHDRGELREQVRRALGKVNPKAAEIFVLRYFEGYGNHEIARMLGTSRSTINVTLHRTRNRLKDELRALWGDEP
jgi:RNA polymerase sigma-70 factor (ECF subfamily)